MPKFFLALMLFFAVLCLFFMSQIDFGNFNKEEHLSSLILAMSNGLFIVSMYVFYRNAKKNEIKKSND